MLTVNEPLNAFRVTVDVWIKSRIKGKMDCHASLAMTKNIDRINMQE